MVEVCVVPVCCVIGCDFFLCNHAHLFHKFNIIKKKIEGGKNRRRSEQTKKREREMNRRVSCRSNNMSEHESQES